MSKKKKSTMVLGYTRTGITVFLPTRRTPDADSFVGWSRGDHVDASRILMEHGEREVDEQVGRWCVRWARMHRVTARPPRRVRHRIRGAAETAILSRGR
jgi:hypothetical protein